MAPKKVSAIRRKHRSVGIVAALFILFMVSSGIAINHTTGLGFDQRHVSNPYLLKLYGIKAPDDIRSFRVGDAWLSFAGSRLYFNEAAVTEVPDGIGAVANDHWVIVAGREELLLLDQQARLVERISWQQAGEIELIGLSGDGRLAVKSTGGLWLADAELLAWQRADDTVETVQWSSPVPAPTALQQSIARHYQGDGLSVERLLLDVHSGRIFGPLGVLVYDLLALAIAFLALSGLVLWARNRRNGKAR
jgi:hypothetical protein